jgi:hypothetical protein
MPEISDLLLIQQKLRSFTTLPELGNFIVNDSSKVVYYQTSILWLAGKGKGEIVSVSGLPEPVKHIPFSEWIVRFCNQVSSHMWQEPTAVNSDDVSDQVRDDWSEYLPNKVLWVPLVYRGAIIGAVLFIRDQPWVKDELGLVQYWAEAIAHAIRGVRPSIRSSFYNSRLFEDKRVALTVAILFVAVSFLPVSLSVNSQAEVVAKNPLIIRSPIEGIIDSVLVQPNEMVQKGDVLVTFEDTAIKAQIDVARQEMAIASAEYRRASQAAVGNRNAASELSMLRSRMEQKQSELNYAKRLLERTTILAERNGIAVVPASFELEGNLLKTGEKIMLLAEPGNMELELWLAVDDSIPFADNARVDVFLNVMPESVFDANLRYVSYQAEVSPSGIFSFRSRADFDSKYEELRIGWRGTAKVYGESVTLFYFVFRKPYAALRRWTGL